MELTERFPDEASAVAWFEPRRWKAEATQGKKPQRPERTKEWLGDQESNLGSQIQNLLSCP